MRVAPGRGGRNYHVDGCANCFVFEWRLGVKLFLHTGETKVAYLNVAFFCYLRWYIVYFVCLRTRSLVKSVVQILRMTSHVCYKPICFQALNLCV